MNTEQTIKTDAIIKKIKSGKQLTRADNIFYLTVVIGHTLHGAKTILTIAENKNACILID
jgi:hypothetical protein